MQPSRLPSLIVIGGGIAGLAAAYYAQKLAAESGRQVQISLLEAGSSWGGKISTVRRQGFVIEGGPDTFLVSKPWGVALCQELGLKDRLQGTNPQQRSTYVLHNNQLQPLPDGLAMMVPSRVMPMLRTPLLSWSQKARLGLDFVIPPRPLDGDESLGGFVARRLGRGAYENLIEPLMSGIYAGDGDQLSLEATFPYLRDLELKYGGLARGVMLSRHQRASNKPAGGWRSSFLTPTGGLLEIVEALLRRLEAGRASLRLNAAAIALARREIGWQLSLASGEELYADQVILATPAFVTAQLLLAVDSQLAELLDAIPYVSTATVSLAYRETELPRPLDGYGYVIPRREGRQALACTWTSTKFPHRAPPGYALLRVFVGRAGQEDSLPWDEASLLQIARHELQQTLGIQALPVLWQVFRWERAMPQYNLGHPERMRRIASQLGGLPGLHLAGSGYRGIGIPDCIHSGQMAAEKALAAMCEVLGESDPTR